MPLRLMIHIKAVFATAIRRLGHAEQKATTDPNVRCQDSRFFSSLTIRKSIGISMHGVAAFALGALGTLSGNFAIYWQPLRDCESAHFRVLIGTVSSFWMLTAGTLLQFRRSSTVGIYALEVFYLFSASLWSWHALLHFSADATWGGWAEQFALVATGSCAYDVLKSNGARLVPWISRIAYLFFAVTCIGFGIQHFRPLSETAAMVPDWLPFGKPFWAATTGVILVTTGVGMFSSSLALLASRIFAALLIAFELVVWLSAVFSVPSSVMSWADNAISVLLIGSAITVAEWVQVTGKRRSTTDVVVML